MPSGQSAASRSTDRRRPSGPRTPAALTQSCSSTRPWAATTAANARERDRDDQRQARGGAACGPRRAVMRHSVGVAAVDVTAREGGGPPRRRTRTTASTPAPAARRPAARCPRSHHSSGSIPGNACSTSSGRNRASIVRDPAPEPGHLGEAGAGPGRSIAASSVVRAIASLAYANSSSRYPCSHSPTKLAHRSSSRAGGVVAPDPAGADERGERVVERGHLAISRRKNS